jgi:threonine/homoserine/homoserine lactone efflux protein
VSIEFLLTSLIIVASPGTGAIYTIAAGSVAWRQGQRARGLRLHARHRAASDRRDDGAGGAAACQRAAFEIVKYAGVAYLLWMAWQTCASRARSRSRPTPIRARAWRVLVDGIAINVLNPKLSIFFVAFLPQFIAAERGERAPAHAGAVGRVHGDDLRRLRALRPVRRRRCATRSSAARRVMAWLRRSFAAAFVMLGAKLALTER